MHLNPWNVLLLAIAGRMNREQVAVIEYLKEENRVLRELLGKKRPRLSDDQRRRLAAKGIALGRKLLSTCCSIVTPDTVSLTNNPYALSAKHLRFDGFEPSAMGDPI